MVSLHTDICLLHLHKTPDVSGQACSLPVLSVDCEAPIGSLTSCFRFHSASNYHKLPHQGNIPQSNCIDLCHANDI